MPGTEQEWNELNNSRYTERRLPRFWENDSRPGRAVFVESLGDSSAGEVPFPQDEVNHPDHYNTGKVECIEAIKASMSAEEFKGYLKGNTLKYLWRYNYKGKPKQDLEKAQWYLNKLIGEV